MHLLVQWVRVRSGSVVVAMKGSDGRLSGLRAAVLWRSRTEREFWAEGWCLVVTWAPR